MVRFLASCALVEETSGKIYREMATTAQAAKDETLAAVWTAMAADEEDHANQLRMAARLSREDIFERAVGAIPEPVEMLTRAESLLEQVRGGMLNELQMLEVAVELEGEFQKLHAAYALVFKDESMQKMFNALARAEAKHIEGLFERVRQFKQRQIG